jgi:hypothetical protein
MHTCTHAHIHIHTHVQQNQDRSHRPLCIHAYIHTYIHTHTDRYRKPKMVATERYAYIHACIHTYTHTYRYGKTKMVATDEEKVEKVEKQEVVRNPNFTFNMEDVVSVCKRRGFIFQSSEIYNGFNGFYDYGPLGVEMKNNIKKTWWRDMVHRR